MKLAELASALGAQLRGPGDLEVERVATLTGAGEGDLSFLSNRRYRPQLDQTRATAVLISPEFADKAPLRPDWIVNEEKMARTADGRFLHCLPVRRNIVVTDGVLDGKHAAVKDEAENRLWTAAAVFDAIG